MKKGMKIGLYVGAIVLLAIVSIILYNNDYKNFIIVTGTLIAICIVCLVAELLNSRNAETRYNSTLKKILRTYDSILVKSTTLPKLEEKNIIQVGSIEDLVDAQLEIRKPIYYQEHSESCSFVLLDNTEACVFILKVRDDVMDSLEIAINDIELKRKMEDDKDEIPEELLKDIEKTTIVRVSKNKYLKVSPIRKKKGEQGTQVQEQTQSIPVEEPQNIQVEQTTPAEVTAEAKPTVAPVVEPIKQQNSNSFELPKDFNNIQQPSMEISKEPVSVDEPVIINANINDVKKEEGVLTKGKSKKVIEELD